MENTCFFFGHRDAPESVRLKLTETVKMMIEQYGVTTFYVGNQGRFDAIVLSVLKEIAANYPNICYYVVLAYLPKESETVNADTIYPEGLESVPKRYCIARRNDWLIERSQYVVCYVSHITGGAAQFMEKAKHKQRIVINVA